MRARSLILLASLALVLAACGDPTTASTTTPQDPATTTTEPVVEAPEAAVLSYGLEAGTSLTYEIGLDQRIELTATGDAATMSAEEIPGSMFVDVSGTTTMTQSVAAGPEPGTYEVTIHADFSNLNFDGTVDGDAFDSAEIPDLAEMDPIDVTVIVDEQGKLISGQDDEFGDLFGLMGGMEGMDGFGTVDAQLGRFIGPTFAEREVTVGDTWSETIETPLFDETQAFTTQIDNVVSGVDTIDGFEVLVIDTTTSTSAFDFDLGEFLIGMMEAFIPPDATEEDLAELEAMKESVRFLFSIDASTADMKSWFDAAAGITRRAEYSGANTFRMDINIPDETTGELVAFTMDMSLDQSVTYRLVDSAGA